MIILFSDLKGKLILRLPERISFRVGKNLKKRSNIFMLNLVGRSKSRGHSNREIFRIKMRFPVMELGFMLDIRLLLNL